MRVQRIAASVVRNQAKPLDLFFAFLWLSIRQGTNRCAVEWIQIDEMCFDEFTTERSGIERNRRYSIVNVIAESRIHT